jgi:hypothetical protein
MQPQNARQALEELVFEDGAYKTTLTRQSRKSGKRIPVDHCVLEFEFRLVLLRSKRATAGNFRVGIIFMGCGIS